MHPGVLVLVVAACSSSAPRSGPPASLAQPVAPPAAPAEPTCGAPSRLCDLVALSKSAQLDALATTLYGATGAEILAKLRAKGLEALVVDPGIVMRLDAALAFPARPGEGPWQFRARFADQLGKVRVYRGLAVTADELASINAQGILATSVRGATPVAPYHVMDQLLGHLMGSAGPRDTMLSISYDAAVSRCVAAMYAKRQPDKTVHVWTIEMPLLDVLSIEVPSALCPAVAPASIECVPPVKGEITDAVRLFACRNFYDPKVESFVQYRIDPSELLDVKPETSTTDCEDVMARVRKDLTTKKAEQHKFCKRPTGALPTPPQPPTPTEATP